MKDKVKVLGDFRLWDIPSTMERSFRAILKKYPCKPMWIIVWEHNDESITNITKNKKSHKGE